GRGVTRAQRSLRILKHHLYLARNPAAALLVAYGKRLGEQAQLAATGRVQTHDEASQCALAAARFPDQRQALPRFQLKADVVHRSDASHRSAPPTLLVEVAANVFSRQQGRAHVLLKPFDGSLRASDCALNKRSGAPSTGTASSRRRVYACRGKRVISRTDPCSTMRPWRMTSTR